MARYVRVNVTSISPDNTDNPAIKPAVNMAYALIGIPDQKEIPLVKAAEAGVLVLASAAGRVKGARDGMADKLVATPQDEIPTVRPPQRSSTRVASRTWTAYGAFPCRLASGSSPAR